ncbi:TauD/TfdA family dioxygenase [Micromonospora sp. NBC_01655]|uniref:TauD/TfdA family dioxygenase n=1 Tax=Micromonospora sp. NBC_01655 TaxID=2975983 RepID=UPI002254501B|nr:TauD/TfdA family dioxygenase [Micromonospora sp. NBC_01655]MCX4472264.1 TauD/TfdA family dioxygenase [Micromonospora sp. NBC_01655]
MAVIDQVRGPADWRADQLAAAGHWQLVLGDAQRAEVRAAVAAVEATGGSPDGLSQADFPLPTFGPRLDRLAAEVTGGCGVGLVRGLPVAGLTARGCELLALGVAAHVGRLVGQGPDGAVLRHVRDRGADPDRPTTRSYEHRRGIGYHADPTDVVALLCVRPARSGGLSTVVSSVAVHNEIVRTRPDLARVLYEPWWYDRRTGDGPDSFAQRPVYARVGGRLTAHYGPDYIRSAQRGAHVPPLTPAQREAMDVLDWLHEDPRFVLGMDLRVGDMQFLANDVVVHARTAYEDHPEPERRRDLIRLWLDTGRD